MRLSCLILLMVSCQFAAVIDNPDRPARGSWDFKPQLEWRIDGAADEPFAGLRNLLVSEDGRIYVHASRSRRTLHFAADGRLISSFAPRGEGPGQVKNHMQSYLTEKSYIVADFDRIHFFDRKGLFKNSVQNLFFRSRPALFLDDGQFVASPVFARGISDTKGEMTLVNLAGGEKKLLHSFSLFTGGAVSNPGGPARIRSYSGLSPAMVITANEKTLYFGYSDKYVIHLLDLKSRRRQSFSIQRKGSRISQEQKKQIMLEREPKISEIELDQLMKNIPNRTTFFSKIECTGGFLFVFVPDPLYQLSGFKNPPRIDIFSPEGRYLYSSSIELPGDFKPLIVTIKKNFMIAILIDSDGEQQLARFRITLPEG